MLYASSLAHISCFTYSGLYAWKLLSPMVYFSFLNEDSMFHLALYKVLIRSTGNSSRGRLVTMHSYVEVLIGKRRIRKGQLICIITSIFNVIESSCLINKAYVTFCVDVCQNFFRMAPDQYDADINIEGFRIWKIKIADQSFGMDILGTEQEILSLFHNMCHVIIRAIAAVTDIDIFYSIQNIVPVNSSSLVMRKPEC